MAIVCIIIGIGLAIVAYRTRNDVQRITPLWFAFWAAANLFGAVHMIATDFPYAYKLAPNSHPSD